MEKFKFDKMDNDVFDGTNYLIENGIADKKRVAIMSASFGGYLAMCGVPLNRTATVVR